MRKEEGRMGSTHEQRGQAHRQAILVVGMHRSGTSSMAGMLSLLGAEAPKTLEIANQWNEKGYWESKEIMSFHDRLLHSADSNWKDWGKFDPNWLGSPRAEVFSREFAPLLAQEFGEAPLFVMKDPRACRFAPFWLRELQRHGISAKIVLPFRNPLEVARSLERRDSMEPVEALLLWLRHCLDAEVATRRLPRSFQRYEALLDDWRGVARKIGDDLDIAWPAWTPESEAKVDAFLTRELRHNVASWDELSLREDVFAWVKGTYECLLALAEGGGDARAEKTLARLNGIRHAFDEASGVFAALVARHRGATQQAKGEAAGLTRHLDTEREKARRAEDVAKGLGNELETSRKQIGDLREALLRSEAALSEARRQAEALRKDMAAGAREIGGLQERLSRLDTDLAGAKKQEESLRADLSGRDANVRRLEAEAAETKTALEAERAVRAAAEAEAARLIEAYREFDDPAVRSLARVVRRSARLGRQMKELASIEGALPGRRRQRRRKLRLARDVELIAGSGLFDREWYLRTYPDVASSGEDPLIHYLQHGVAEGRNPNPLFDTDWYLRQYPDVAATGLNPLVHFIEKGWREGRDPNPLFDTAWYLKKYPDVAKAGINPLAHYVESGERENRDPSAEFSTRFYRTHAQAKGASDALAHYLWIGRLSGLPVKPIVRRIQPLLLHSDRTVRIETKRQPGRIAIMAHIYHTDLSEEIARYLDNIPFTYDLLISTDSSRKRETLLQSFSRLKGVNEIDVQIVENRGRDIAPFLVTFGPRIAEYDYGLHIHSKKSEHSTETEGWFKHLMTSLLDSKLYVENIFEEFIRNKKRGILYPSPYPAIERHMHWAGNFDLAKEVMDKIGLVLDEEKRFEIEFPAGSMFWFRPAALEPLLRADLRFDDFPPEQGQTNNTLAHAIERLFLTVAEKRGYTSSPVMPTGRSVKGKSSPSFTASRQASTSNSSLAPGAVRIERVQPEWKFERERQFTAAMAELHARDTQKYENVEVSIIMPAFNRGRSIEKAVASVIGQTHSNWRLIIIDDGSTDDTRERLERFKDDDRILYVWQENSGVSSARNRGLSLASGEYVFYLDSDNAWRQDFLKTMIVFLAYRRLDAAYAGLHVIGDENITQYYRGDLFSWRECYKDNYIDMNIYAHRRDIVENPSIRFDESLERLVDWDFMLRANVHGRVAFAPFIGADYYNGSQGNRISRTKYVNGDLTIYEDVIRSKHSALPDGHENIDVFARDEYGRDRNTQHIVRFYPDYRVNNAYQNLLYCSFGYLDLKPADINECLTFLKNKSTRDRQDGDVVFHLHWVAPIFAPAKDEAEAAARIDRFLATAREFVRLGGRIFWTIHNAISHEGRYFEQEVRFLRALCELADVIHVHDSATRMLAEEYFTIPLQKMMVAQHGSYLGTLPDEISREEARARLGIPKSATVFIMFGQLRAYKGLDELIEAYESVSALDPNCWLVLAGKPLQVNLDELNDRLSRLPNVILRPSYVPDEEVQNYLRAADMAVLPYRAVLTSGSVFLAFSFELPVITPKKGLLSRTVEDGVNGFFFDTEAGVCLAQAMKKYLALDPASRRELALAALDTAKSHRWEDASRKLLRFVEGPGFGDKTTAEIAGSQKTFFVRTGARKIDGAKCTAIILHYRNLEDTERCVRSVLTQDGELGVIIVSNNESLSDAMHLAQQFPDATVVQNEDNLGYAAGNNIGLWMCRRAHCEFFWILNPDIVVPEGYLASMRTRVEAHAEYNLFGSTVTFGAEPTKIWFGGGDVSLEDGGFSTHRYIGKSLGEAPSEPYECDYLTGASIFGRTEVLDEIGYIPEDYFLYFEETDWFMRARSLDERPLVFPDIHLLHWKRSEEGGLPTRAYCYYFVRNAHIFGHRYAPDAFQARERKVAEFISAWLRRVRERAPDQLQDYERIFARAVADGRRNQTGIARI